MGKRIIIGRDVLNLLQSHPEGLTISEIASRLETSEEHIALILKKRLKSNCIEDKDHRWLLRTMKAKMIDSYKDQSIEKENVTSDSEQVEENESHFIQSLTSESETITVTEIGQYLGIKSSEVNLLMAKMGLITGEPGHWRLTEKGAPYAKKHAGRMRGRKYMYYTWKNQVIEMIMVFAEEQAIKEAVETDLL